MIEMKDNEFNELINFLKINYGIDLTSKKNLIEGRLGNMLTARGYDNYADYLKFAFSDITKNEITNLVNKLTTNHTYFMRETGHFDYFKEKVLPFIETNSSNQRDIRIWSAGCSSGEEPYTLAMLIADYFKQEKALWDSKVLATDISVKVLTMAEKGVYASESIESLPKLWKTSYLTKIDEENYKFSDKIRNEIVFRIFNLMDEKYPFKRKFHTIFCRNVMIYFDKKTKIQLINKFYDLTEPGGYLFIGHSESIGKAESRYKYIMPAVYRKG